MDILQVITLSIVQGITEFLPISSSAHLVLVPYFTQWSDQGILFDLGVHVGTLFAVMLYFKREVAALCRGAWLALTGQRQQPEARLFMLLTLSTLPLLVTAFFIKEWLAVVGRYVEVIAFTSIFYGLLLYWADKRVQNCAFKKIPDLQKKEAFIFGLFQALALIPGTSRSGICMTAGRLMGYSRTESSRFAMLMSIPVILMLGFYALCVHQPSHHVGTVEGLWLGMFLAFVTAFLAIKALMTWVERVGFAPFVIYRVLLGVVILGFVYL